MPRELIGPEFLKGKKGLVLGVANKWSIAWGIAQVLDAYGAQLAFTYQDDRLKDSVADLARSLQRQSLLIPCDVSRDEAIQGVMDRIQSEFGSL